MLPLLRARPTFLLVGTLEPRKGHGQVLAAFDLLWKSGFVVNLALVGKQGWMVEALVANLRVHSSLGRQLFWLDATTDEFLEKIYTSATCLIAPSEGEGFGLPLVEAAHHKLPIIARDIPVFREVAGPHAYYFSGMEPAVLADAVKNWLALFSSGQHPKSDDLPTLTWEQSTAQLLDVVLNDKWYAHWESDGTFRCTAADPRLKTLVGKRVGDSMESTGAEGFLFYGPYISLPAGDYRIRVHGEITNPGAVDFRVETTANFGNTILSLSPLHVTRSSALIADVHVRLTTPVSDFEVRLWVSAQTAMRAQYLEISLQAAPSAEKVARRTVPLKTQSEGNITVDKPEPRNPSRDVLQEILLEEDDEFIHAAFLALLKRRPDANGALMYARELRKGTGKLQILAEIAASEESRLAGGDIPGLAEACAREGIDAAGNPGAVVPPPEVNAVTRAEQLLVVGDVGKFIDLAYWKLLNRAPDAKGAASYRSRLETGTSKTQILSELFTSTESREKRIELPGLRDAFAREGLQVVEAIRISAPEPALRSISGARSISELLALDGAAFVECAYQTLLERTPDEEGFQHRMELLLNGTSKLQILSEIAASEEAGSVATELPGLTAAISRHKLSRAPILGAVVRLLTGAEGDSAVERRVRASEQRLALLESRCRPQFEQLATDVARLSVLEKEVQAEFRDVDARLASIERSISGFQRLVEEYADHPAGSALSNPDKSPQLSSNRVAVDLRAEEVARDFRRIRRDTEQFRKSG
ncbi:MAG: DUF4214 domain-containing protein [Usitatibacteraceae bacterium]